MALSSERRFRLVSDYAVSRGFVSGFPNFHEASSGNGRVGGVMLLPGSTAEWRDVPRDMYDVFPSSTIGERFRAAADYAADIGYVGAFPNCQEQDDGNGVVLGTILIRPGEGEWREVGRSELGAPDIDDVPAMMTAAWDYAIASGFAGGFPTFHQVDHGTGVGYGVVLINPGAGESRDVRVADLYLMNAKAERTCIILCRFRDAAGVLTPTPSARQFYERFFLSRSPQSLREYYLDVTHGRVNIVGHVFGWLDIGHTLAEHVIPDAQPTPVQLKTQRRHAYDWGIAAARATGVDVDSYPRRVVVINQVTDWGGVVPGQAMLLPDFAIDTWSISRAAHEFGHVLGLGDAFRTEIAADGTATDARYLDEHCIMSYITRGSRFITTFEGRTMDAGPVLNGVYANALGGIPAGRFHEVLAAGAAETISIAPLSQPDVEGALLVRIPPTLARPRSYWVEWHQKAGWDRAIPASRVALHETRNGDGASYVVSRLGRQSLKSPSDEALVTPDGSMAVHLEAIDGLAARVRVWELGPARQHEVRIRRVVVRPAPAVLGERVVIRNDRLHVVNLNGWMLSGTESPTRSSVSTYHFPDFTLGPGHDVTVWTGSGIDDGQNLYWGRNQPVWNTRTFDAVVLVDNNGLEISRRWF